MANTQSHTHARRTHNHTPSAPAGHPVTHPVLAGHTITYPTCSEHTFTHPALAGHMVLHPARAGKPFKHLGRGGHTITHPARGEHTITNPEHRRTRNHTPIPVLDLDGLGAGQGRDTEVVETTLLEDLSTSLEPDRLTELNTRVLGQDLFFFFSLSSSSAPLICALIPPHLISLHVQLCAVYTW